MMDNSFFDKIYDELRSIYRGIKNIFIWMPIVYNDRQWDHYYFLKMLEFKLNLMAECFKNEGHGVNAEKDAKRMKMCAELCRRLCEDDYAKIALEQHREKWGDLNFECKKIDDSEFSEVFMSRPKCISEEDKAKETIESKKIWEKEEFLKNQDKEKLFDTIKKYILGWWD